MFLVGIISILLLLLLPARAEVATVLYFRMEMRVEDLEVMSEERSEETADFLMECGLTCSRRQSQARQCNSFSYDGHHATCSLAVVRSQFYFNLRGWLCSLPG